MKGVSPVSYTHLGVYKRQAHLHGHGRRQRHPHPHRRRRRRGRVRQGPGGLQGCLLYTSTQCCAPTTASSSSCSTLPRQDLDLLARIVERDGLELLRIVQAAEQDLLPGGVVDDLHGDVYKRQMLSMAGTVAPSSSGSPNTEAYPSASMFSSAHSRASSYDCGLISSPPAHPEPSRLAHLVRGPPSECRKNSPVRLR